jgi:hypothetical protein
MVTRMTPSNAFTIPGTVDLGDVVAVPVTADTVVAVAVQVAGMNPMVFVPPAVQVVPVPPPENAIIMAAPTYTLAPTVVDGEAAGLVGWHQVPNVPEWRLFTDVGEWRGHIKRHADNSFSAYHGDLLLGVTADFDKAKIAVESGKKLRAQRKKKETAPAAPTAPALPAPMPVAIAAPLPQTPDVAPAAHAETDALTLGTLRAFMPPEVINDLESLTVRAYQGKEALDMATLDRKGSGHRDTKWYEGPPVQGWEGLLITLMKSVGLDKFRPEDGALISIQPGTSPSRLDAELLLKAGVPMATIQACTVPGTPYEAIVVRRGKR